MADRYWVGGSGTWNTTSTTNWSASSGGASGASVPTAADSVFFDQAGPYTVTMTGALNCLDITVSGASVTFATGTTPTLSVASNWATDATTVWNSTGTITFTATTSKTILTNGITINAPVTFNGTGGTWTLLSNFTLGSTLTTTLTAGTLALSTFTLTTGLFASSGSVARTLNFGTGKIVLNSATTSTVWTTATVTNLTVSGTPLVECIGGGTAVTKTINTGALSEANSISFSLLETTGSVTYTFTASNVVRNLLINGSQRVTNIAITIYGNYTYLDTNGVTNFIQGANAWTFGATSGTKTITSTPSNTFGASVYFDGTGDYLTVPDADPLDFGTGDFTVECFVNFSALTSNRVLFDKWSSGSTGGWQLYWRATGTSLAFLSGNAGGTGTVILQDGNVNRVAAGAWYHVAVARQGTTINLFVNGTLVSSATDSTDYTSTVNLGIGRQISTNTNDFFGYISNARIVKGTAVYTANFTPPISNLTNISGTSLLTCQSSSTITDNSSNAYTISVFGNTGPSLLMVNEPLYDFPITINSVGATTQLSSSITVGPTRTVTLTAGTFNLNNLILTTGIFASSGSTARTLAFGTGKIELFSTATATIWNTGTITNMTVTGTPLVECAGGGGAVTKTINTGALTEANSIDFSLLETMFYNATTTVTYTFTGNNTVKNLIINGWQIITNIAITIFGNYTYSATNGITRFQSGVNIWTFGATSGARTITNSPANVFGASAYFDGTGDYLSVGTTSSFNALHGTSALFTIEGWMWFGTSAIVGMFSTIAGTVSTTDIGVGFWKDASNNLRLMIQRGVASSAVIDATSTSGVPLNRWVHVAVTYDQSLASNNCNFYINGVLSGTSSKTANAPSASNSTYSGRINALANTAGTACFISNLRICDSIVYAGNFTPPTSNLTAISGTQLLTCQSSTNPITDASTNAYAITVSGNTTASPWQVNSIVYDYPWTVGSAVSTAVWTLASNQSQGPTRNFTLSQGIFDFNGYTLVGGNLGVATGTVTVNNTVGNSNINLGIPVNQSSGNVTFNPNLIVSNWAGYTLSAGNLTILDNRIVQSNAFITNSSSNRIIAFSNTGELRLTGAGVNTAIGCTSPNTYFVFSASNGSNLTYTGNVYFNITDAGSVGNRMLNFTQNATTTLSAPMNITTAGNRGVVINPSATDNIILHGNFYNVDFTGMNAKLFLGGGYTANIYGNFIMANSGNPDPQANSFAGSIIFTGNTAATFTTYDQPVSWGLTLNTANNTNITQIGNFIGIHPNSIGNFTSGNLNLNGYYINVGQLVFNSGNIKEIDFTTVGSKINVFDGNQSVNGSANKSGNNTIFAVATSTTNFPVLKGNWIINFTYAGNGGSATGYRQLNFANAISNTIRNTYYKISSVLDTANSFNLNPLATDTIYFTNNSNLYDLNLTNFGSNVNLQGNLTLVNNWTISNMAGNFYMSPSQESTAEIITIGQTSLQVGNCTINTNDKPIYARANLSYANNIITSNLNLQPNTANVSNNWYYRLDLFEANLTINPNVVIKASSLYGIYSTTNKFISWGENSRIELYGNQSQANFSATPNQRTFTLFLGNVGNITQTGNPNIYLSYAGSVGNRYIKYNSGNANGNLVGSGSFLSLTTGSSPGIVINPAATDNIGVTDFISGGDSNPCKFLDLDLRGFAGNFRMPGTFNLSTGQTVYVAGNLWASANTKFINDNGNGTIRFWPAGGNSNSGRTTSYLLSESNTAWSNIALVTGNLTLGANVTLGSNFTILSGGNVNTNSSFTLQLANSNINLNNFTFTLDNYLESSNANKILNFGDSGVLRAYANNTFISNIGNTGTTFQGNVNVFVQTSNANTYFVVIGPSAIAAGYSLRFADSPLNNTITIQNNTTANVSMRQSFTTDQILNFGNLTIGSNTIFSFTGNITIPSTQNVAVQTSQWSWNPAAGNTVYINGGNTLKPIGLSMTGGSNDSVYIISNSFRSNQSVTFGRGRLDLNGQEFEVGNLTITGSNTTSRTVVWNSGNLVINRNFLSFGGSLANNSTETTSWSNGTGIGRYKFTFTSSSTTTCNVGNNNSVVALNGILDLGGTGTLTTNGNVGFTDLVCSNFVANATRNLRTERACTLSFSTTLRLDNFTYNSGANGRILDIRSNSQTDGSWNIITTNNANLMGEGADWLRVANIRFTPFTSGTPLKWYLGSNSTSLSNVTGALFQTLDVANGYYKAIQLTSGTSFVVPNDWNNANNEIHMWGGGGGGAASSWNGSTDRAGGGGGGGGGYTKISNIALTPGGTITYTIGAGGAGGQNKAISPTYNDQGSNGGNTTFVVTPTTYTANGGIRGTTTNAPIGGLGGAGGTGGTFNGGRGGNGSQGIRPTSFPSMAGGGGGGGAAGPFGNGGNGGSGGISSPTGTSNRAAGGGGGGYSGGFDGSDGNGFTGVGGQGGNNRLGLGGGAATNFGNPGSNGGGGSGTGNLNPAAPAFSPAAGSQGIDVLGTFGGGAGSGGGSFWDAGGIFPSTPTAYGAGGGAGGQPLATGRGSGAAGVGGQIVIAYAIQGNGPAPGGNNTGGMFLLN